MKDKQKELYILAEQCLSRIGDAMDTIAKQYGYADADDLINSTFVPPTKKRLNNAAIV